VKKLEKTVKTGKARRKAKIVVSDDEEEFKDPSKQGRKIAVIDQDPDISLVQHDVEVKGRHEQEIKFETEDIKSEPEQTTTKLQQRQEKAGYEAAVRLQEQLDEEERQRIARVHEEASLFNVDE
nr:hypothetical protein [Tanacetum cinerariifolium]